MSNFLKSAFTLFGSPSPFRRRRKFASSESIFNEAAIPNFYKSIFTTENPMYAKFRYKGLPFAHELTTLFKDVVANGEYTWIPSCGVLPSQLDNDDNDDNGVAAIEEG
ncbi:hypothetical protein MTR_7g056530 [Medicago truncatula]|uniref:Uncharacterized protein n=1 Tax=Medicago truncatula TaxID=3880 RepID=A0A072TYX1_MEDTR|nr:hypothetical protein MTR_7g056530 [Medicago truncatula]